MWPLQWSYDLVEPNWGGLNRPLPKELSSEGERKHKSEKKGMEHILLFLLIPLSLSTNGAQIHLISVSVGRNWDSDQQFEVRKASTQINLLPVSQGHLPSYPWRADAKSKKGANWTHQHDRFQTCRCIFGLWTKSIKQGIGKRCHLSLSTFPFEKLLEVWLWECIYDFYLYLCLHTYT